MAMEEPDFLPVTRTMRYRTDDPIQNLRIKVIMRCQGGDDTETQWITKERVFTWQEKVFGPAEFARYKDMLEVGEPQHGTTFRSRKKARTPLEDRYCMAIEQVAAGAPIYSYVDADPFQDLTEYAQNVTTSPFEKPTPLAQRMMKVEEKRGRCATRLFPCQFLSCPFPLILSHTQTQAYAHPYSLTLSPSFLLSTSLSLPPSLLLSTSLSPLHPCCLHLCLFLIVSFPLPFSS